MADEKPTLVDYLDKQLSPFEVVPFNAVDSLVLSSLCYCNFELGPIGHTQGSEPVELSGAITGIGFEELLGGSWLSDQADELSRRFIANLLMSPRYKNTKVAFYAHETLANIEKQFSAITFFLPNGSAYLAYRGTDGTLAGWKEDFNLCFMDVVPSQASALRYLSGVASSFSGPIILGGHSKGGNLAEYAALCAHEDVYSRITAVYNHDGPSFMADPSPRIDDPAFQALLHKSVPASSVFGMILEKRNDYRIVESNAFALMQHAPFSWIVDGDDFLYRTELNRGASYFDESLSTWLASFTPQERERFIDTMYNLVSTSASEKTSEITDNLLGSLAKMAQSGSKLDDNTQKFCIDVGKAAAKALKDEAFAQLRSIPPSLPKPEVKALPDIIAGRLKDMKPFGKDEAQ